MRRAFTSLSLLAGALFSGCASYQPEHLTLGCACLVKHHPEPDGAVDGSESLAGMLKIDLRPGDQHADREDGFGIRLPVPGAPLPEGMRRGALELGAVVGTIGDQSFVTLDEAGREPLVLVDPMAAGSVSDADAARLAGIGTKVDVFLTALRKGTLESRCSFECYFYHGSGNEEGTTAGTPINEKTLQEARRIIRHFQELGKR
jgi:hypothetical protein